MEVNMSIVYSYYEGLYINLTNKCPCSCDFCIRNYTDNLGSADSLFLDKEPTVDEVKEELVKWNIKEFNEVIFCGYGEPTERLPELLEIAEFVKKEYGLPVRLNTNGLADLIWKRETAPDLEGKIDAVSVSMNEADAQKYFDLCHPVFGMESYDAMIKYISDVKKYVPDVATSIVSVITPESIELCRKKAEELGVTFKVR
jgi:TatD family-associated radical SAM protein